MRTQTLSDVFQAIHDLDRTFQAVAFREAMDDHQANDLLKMLHACQHACGDALTRLPAVALAAAPEPGHIEHGEAVGMDDTLTFNYVGPIA